MDAPATARSGFICISCKSPIAFSQLGKFECGQCEYPYEATANGLKYNSDPLLFRDFKRQFLLYKALSNNGEVAYRTLAEDSLSIAEKPEVRDFRDFILARAKEGKLLDVGCGILPLPGYLQFPGQPFELYGLDPFDIPEFQGVGITGSCEYLPFPDQTFDALTFGGSLDHVCSLEKTASEVARVLRPGGHVFVFMSDRYQSPARRFVELLRKIALSFRDGYSYFRWQVHANRSVFYIPKGAIDPFHSFPETPSRIATLMRSVGLTHLETRPFTSDVIGKYAFVAFRKAE